LPEKRGVLQKRAFGMHEYKVVPAPSRPGKVRGVRAPAERFAQGLAELLNEHAAQGWEFVRAETFAVEERRGWFGRTAVVNRTVLVLRRARAEAAAAPAALGGRSVLAEPPPPLGRRAAPPPGPAPRAGAPEPAARPEPGPDPAPAARPEPIFRPGAMIRADGPRKYPPLRAPAAPTPPADEPR
jgi:hypothetical protein